MRSRIVFSALGATLVAIGVIGFIPDPLVSVTGIVAINGIHNLVRIITVTSFQLTFLLPIATRKIILGAGLIYSGASIPGSLARDSGPPDLLSAIADGWLHVVVAALLVAIGLATQEDERRSDNSPGAAMS